mgnify:CR=1 FL=1
MPHNSDFKYSILVHYNEIGLKKNNRKFFENKFINNIKLHLGSLKFDKISLISARVIIKNVNFQMWPEYKSVLSNVMGMGNATLMIEAKTDIKDIKKAIDVLLEQAIFNTFRVTTKRHYKDFKKTSVETNIHIGQYIQDKTQQSVNLSNPEVNFILEILKDKSYIGINKIIGHGGLPANSQEKALSLISSGIDSPVSSFEMIKRGVALDYVHFHSYPAVNRQSISNVKAILDLLLNYQLSTTLYLVPLLDIQQEIMKRVEEKYWVIFFRRAMVSIANIIAKQKKIVALVTGESVGQVASQTLSNIRAIDEVSELPILRPLSGMNKEEIINKANIINTYNISIKPYQDCCSHFVPIHPETKAKIDRVRDIENNLDLDDLYNAAIENMEQTNFKYN